MVSICNTTAAFFIEGGICTFVFSLEESSINNVHDGVDFEALAGRGTDVELSVGVVFDSALTAAIPVFRFFSRPQSAA